jgi:superfamily II DNA or RNA helicase
MSCKVLIDNLNEETKNRIDNELKIIVEESNSFSKNFSNKSSTQKIIYPYEIYNEHVYLPFYYSYNVLGLKRPSTNLESKIDVKFIMELKEEQKEVKTEAIKLLNTTGCVLLALRCGFGKTFCATYLACKIGLKTLIIVNKVVLIKQWEESILKTCPSALIQKLTAKSKKQNADFYIINAQNVCKLSSSFFTDIQTLIIDEIHLIMAETLSKSLQYIFPKYLIGLSATPYRPDGLTKLLDVYCGEYKIVRDLYKQHFVFKIDTGFKPTEEYQRDGKLNWGIILDSQANDEKRNDLIIQIVHDYSTRNFLILVKRISQGEYILEKLKEIGIEVDSLLGKNQVFNKDVRVLIGTTSKVGVGFDWPKADALLLASDLEEYFIQYLGRVFRRQDIVPIIFDLVDDHKTLIRHYNTRRKIYKKHGGEISILEKYSSFKNNNFEYILK